MSCTVHCTCTCRAYILLCCTHSVFFFSNVRFFDIGSVFEIEFCFLILLLFLKSNQVEYFLYAVKININVIIYIKTNYHNTHNIKCILLHNGNFDSILRHLLISDIKCTFIEVARKRCHTVNMVDNFCLTYYIHIGKSIYNL